MQSNFKSLNLIDHIETHKIRTEIIQNGTILAKTRTRFAPICFILHGNFLLAVQEYSVKNSIISDF